MSIVVPAWPNQLYEDNSHHVVLESRTPSPPRPAPKPITPAVSARTVTEHSTASAVHTCTEMLKQSMSESRRTFLQDFNASQEAVTLRKVEEQPATVHPCELDDKHGYRKRKISFKIKNTLTPSKRITTTTLSVNKVHRLAQKFNELVNEEPKIARAARRANSTRIRDSTAGGIDTQKRPSIRPKPQKLEDRKPADPKKKPSVKRKISVKKIRMEKHQDGSDEKMCVTAKIKYLEAPQTVQKQEVGSEEQSMSRDESHQRLTVESSDFKHSEQHKTSEQCSVKQTFINQADLHGNINVNTDLRKEHVIKETNEETDETDSPGAITHNRPKHMLKTRSTSTGSVKAAIEIFERRKSSTTLDISKVNKQICHDTGSNNTITKQHSVNTNTSTVASNASVKNLVPKPKIPDKNVTKTKSLVTKEGVRKFRIISPKVDSDSTSKNNMSELQTYFATKSIGKNDKTQQSTNDSNTRDSSSQITENKSVKRNIFQHDDDSISLLNSSKHNLSSDISSTEDIRKRLSPSDEKLLRTTDLSSSSCEDTVLEVKHIPHTNSRISVIINEELPTKQHVDKCPDKVETEKTMKSESSSLYDGLKITKTTPPSQLLKMAVSEERLVTVDAAQSNMRPNSSFLWRSKSRDSTYFNTYTAIMYEDGEEPLTDDDSKKISKSFYEDTGQPDTKFEESRRYSQYDEPKSALVNKELADILKKRREQDPTQEEQIYDTIKNVTEQIEKSVGELEASLEDLYDTVDPRPLNITTVNEGADEDESLVDQILAKTDEILKQYNNPKTLYKPDAGTKTPEDANWKDNASIHSYESFYNSNYEEMDTHYEYPKNLVHRTQSNASEDLYETLSTPDKHVAVDTSAKNTSVYQKPLPLLPNVISPKEASGKVSNIYQKPLPQIPNVVSNNEEQTDKVLSNRNVNIYQKPLPRLPSEQSTVELKMDKSKIYHKPLPRLPNEDDESEQRSPVKIIKKPLPQIPTAQFYHEDVDEAEENIYSTLSNASTPQKPHNPSLIVPKINVQGPNVSPKYLKPVFAKPQVQKEDPYDFLKSPSDCYESIYNDGSEQIQQAMNRILNNKYLDSTEAQLSGDVPGCYESIYSGGYRKEDSISMYHSSLMMFRRDEGSSSGSNRDSVISCDQQSNSLYGKCGWNMEGGALGSEISSSDRSDDWEDMSDAEQDDKAESGFVIIHEKQRNKKHPGWSHKVRDQWTNSPKKVVILEEDASSDPYHYYESLHSDDDFDSFDSESDDDSFTKINQNDSGVDMGHPQLPEPPGANSGSSNIYGFTRLAASANKHMKRLRRNWSLTKNDITKSLSRMTKKKSTTNLSSPSPDRPGVSPTLEPPPVPRDYERPVKIYDKLEKKVRPPSRPVLPPSSTVAHTCIYSSTSPSKSPGSVYAQTSPELVVDSGKSYQNVEYKSVQSQMQEKTTNTNTVGRRKNWLKFRRSTSMSEPAGDEANSMTKSTFYLTSEMDVDTGQVTIARPTSLVDEKPAVPARRRARPPSTQRPASPPPPAPVSPADNSPTSKCQKSRSTSWYAECGLFKAPLAPSAQLILPPLPTSPPPPALVAQYQQQGNTCWYAEVGLYQQNGSTPSSSSAENSGSTTSQYPKHYQQHYQQSKQHEHTLAYQQLHSQLHTQLQQYHQMTELHRQKDRNQQNVNEIVSLKEQNPQNMQDDTTSTDVEQYYNMLNDRTSTLEDEEVENSYYNEEFPPVVLRESCEGETFVRDTLKRHQSADMQLLLKDEPLYQFYDAAVAESACQETSSDSDYDGYEEIGTQKDSGKEDSISPLPPCTPTSMKPSVKQLVSPVSNGVSGRTLWCEIPEIIQSEILCTLNSSQRKLQEAKFEIITSEASYLNSLTVLEEHFMSVLDKDTLLDTEDRDILFGNIRPVRECSERLLSDLEICWQDNILLNGICEVIYMHCIEHFDVYVRYCEGQVHLGAALKRCREPKNAFSEALRQLELKPACQALSLYSFLMLPMQRITRMPLLIDAVLKRLTPADEEYKSCQQALMSLNDIVMRCNEGARNVERQVETARIVRLLEYPSHIQPIQLTGRYLVRSGELTQLVTRNDEVKLTFGKKFTKIPLTLYLFEDVLLVTRKKNNSSNEDYFTVLHHCPRNFVELTTSSTDNSVLTLPVKDVQGRHLLFLTMLENQERRTVEMMLSCATETDRQRWLEALSPPVSDNPYERVYESWDCPQVRAIHWYTTTQPDELALAKGDVVNVTRKMADGWYHGERIRDGVSGWFPGNHTTEIANPHVRARNLKQRYRLLAFTGSYLNKTNNNMNK
ncbi:Ephexin [Carabus blaptoides fortunei]